MTIDEGMNSIVLMALKDRAQRFHPSSFDTAELVAGCGSIFDILRFAV